MKESNNTQEPKKSGHGCLIAFLIFLFLILTTLGGGYWIYKRITSGFSLAITSSDLDMMFPIVQATDSPATLRK